MNTIELRDVHKSFGSLHAVKGVSLSLRQGSVFGLIGRNGAGKTTTIRMIMSIYEPDGGEILCNGEPVNRTFRDKVGYLPEERGLYAKMKVLDALMFFAEIKCAPLAKAKQRALEYLKRLGLAERATHKIETLSKGNQQKVQFIAAIIHDPDIVILDEPFSGLDPVNTSLIINMIEELKAQGKAILFSTHIMDFAERLCDHIALIDQGKVLLEGSLTDIKRQHGSNQVAIESPDDLAFLFSLTGITSASQDDDTVTVSLTDSSQVQPLLAELVRRHISVTRFDASPRKLHDIFVSLVGHGDELLEAEEAGS